MKVDCILDMFSYRCWAPEVELRPVRKGHRVTEKPDFFFAETTWDSVGGQFRLVDEADQHQLKQLLKQYHKLNVPTIIWNKEDPPHFGDYDAINPFFDHICTTAEECVDRHRNVVGHDRVHAMPFAAQPAIHFFDPNIERVARPCFVGNYYKKKYDDRKRQIEYIVHPAMQYGLYIFDRSFGEIRFKNPQFKNTFGYPEDLKHHIVGGLSYESLCKIYRQFSAFLNVNTVNDSHTMCSRRVFELLCSGSPVISAPASALTTLLGEAILQSEDATTTRTYLDRLLHDPEFWKRISLEGQRKILSQHTYAHRLRTLLQQCDISEPTDLNDRIAHYEQSARCNTQEELTTYLGKIHEWDMYEPECQ